MISPRSLNSPYLFATVKVCILSCFIILLLELIFRSFDQFYKWRSYFWFWLNENVQFYQSLSLINWFYANKQNAFQHSLTFQNFCNFIEPKKTKQVAWVLFRISTHIDVWENQIYLARTLSVRKILANVSNSVFRSFPCFDRTVLRQIKIVR